MILSVRRYGNYTTIYNKKKKKKKIWNNFFYFLHQTYCKNGTNKQNIVHM